MRHTEDFEITLEDGRYMFFQISVTSWGTGPTMPSWNYPGDPGDPPEWDIDFIEVADAPARLRDDPDYERVPNKRYIKPWWRELWAMLRGRPITEPNPEWAALAQIADEHVENNYDFEPPEPDYDYWERDPW